MDLLRIAARVAADAGPAAIATWYEGGGYGPEDIVGGLPDHDGEVWAGLYGFGWVIAFQDPATIAPDAEVDGAGVVSTWGEMLAHEDFKEAASALRPFPSVEAFAADDQTIRFMCSYEDDERAGIEQELRARGFGTAADRVQSVEF